MPAVLDAPLRTERRWRPWVVCGSVLVVAAIVAIPSSHIELCAMFVAGAYVTLTFYDFFSLRTIGARHVPYRIAAIAAFTSYSIGHNLGATVFTGGDADGAPGYTQIYQNGQNKYDGDKDGVHDGVAFGPAAAHCGPLR